MQQQQSSFDSSARTFAAGAWGAGRLDERMLLKEAHHRIKNDLQIVASLLAIQARASADEALSRPLLEAAKRVHAVARLHQRLQAAGDGSVEISELLSDICRDVLESGFDRPNVAVAVSAESALLDGGRASALALIVNELLTNALKHAFGDGGGRLRVAFRLVGASGELTVADDGRGLPESVPLQSGMGLALVAQLARKLGGRLVYDRPAEGACIRVLFPVITLDLSPAG